MGYGMQEQVPNFTAAGGNYEVSIPLRPSVMQLGFLTAFVRVAELYVLGLRPAGTHDRMAPAARSRKLQSVSYLCFIISISTYFYY